MKQQLSIGGKSYLLDVEKAKKTKSMVEIPPRRVGQLYQDISPNSNREVYVLGLGLDSVDGVALYSLTDWEMYGANVVVEDYMNITDEEWDDITNGDGGDFVEVTVNKVK